MEILIILLSILILLTIVKGIFMGMAQEALKNAAASIDAGILVINEKIDNLIESNNGQSAKIDELIHEIDLLNADKADMATADEINTALQPRIDAINALGV